MSPFAHISLADRVRLLSPSRRSQMFVLIAEKPGALSDVRHDWWRFWARPEQVISQKEIEGHGLIVVTGGRREGKTRAIVEAFIREVDEGRAMRPRVFAATEGDVDKAVLHGVSGIITNLTPEQRSRWAWISAEGPAGVVRVKNKLGKQVEIVCFTAKAPEQAVSHAGDLDLYDDVAKWGVHAVTAWTHARLSCSEGYACGLVATTRRGTALIRKLLGGAIEGVLVKQLRLGGNRNNLNARWRSQMKAELQEVAGDMLRQELDDEDISAASPFADLPWDVIHVSSVDQNVFEEVVCAVDPADGKGGNHDEWGIGAAARRSDRHVVALEDRSGSYDDAEAGEAILNLCELRGISKILAETNRGPRVLAAIRAAHFARELRRLRSDATAAPRAMPELVGVNAKDQKVLRAGPVRTLYLDGLLHHAPGLDVLDRRGGEPRSLEKQMREWDPSGPRRPRTDDRIDWLVHAATHLAGLSVKMGEMSEQDEAAIVAEQCAASAEMNAMFAARANGRTTQPNGDLEPMKVEGAVPGDARYAAAPMVTRTPAWRGRSFF